MKVINTFVLFLTTALPLVVHAGPGEAGHTHGHDDGHAHVQAIDKDQASSTAIKVIGKLVEKGKLDQSWTNAKLVSTEQKGNEWVITYNNASASDATKRNLYVFLTLGGQYVAANFSGK